MKRLRYDLILFFCFIISSTFVTGQNPFDVYRKADPNPKKVELIAYNTSLTTPAKKNHAGPAEVNKRNPNSLKEPSERKTVSLNEEVSKSPVIPTRSKTNNPFDIKKSAEEIPEAKIVNLVPTSDRNSPRPSNTILNGENASDSSSFEDETLNSHLIVNEIIPEASEESLKAASNPFDIQSGEDSGKILDLIDNNADVEDKRTTFDEELSTYNLETNQTTGSLPKDKKVKGYFTNILANYVFWILLFFLVLLTFIVNLNRKLIPDISKSLLSDNYLRISYREYNKGFTPFLCYMLYANFFVQGGLFLYLSQKTVSGDLTYSWYSLIGLFAAVYLVRHLVLWIIGALFPVNKETSQHNFVIMQFNLFLGLIFFGLNWMLAFGPENMSKPLMFTGLGVMAIMFLLRQFRGLLLSLRILSHHTFHFFLYLCAIEIAPVIILFKLISVNF